MPDKISLRRVEELAAMLGDMDAVFSRALLSESAAALEALVRLVEAGEALHRTRAMKDLNAALTQFNAALAQFTDDRKVKP